MRSENIALSRNSDDGNKDVGLQDGGRELVRVIVSVRLEGW